ncbi:acyl-CoA synthetase [Cupriavidus gilardii]|uniref:acyl-CoA synthetase n=1 Tax=Cupriavidus gilardii TaxID=82541 RepID=UPI001580F730|nr:acyl-CoA synthetase [Cupriavidus gilardii]MCT9070433.1 acyl-CoA synthetase [Cupriavidus gilardii]QKS61181.1 acyl-CoA synthetase [Cupriavidus gilardii]
MTLDQQAAIRRAHQHGVGDILRRSAQRTPDKTAIVCGDVQWSYRDFDQICDRLVAALSQQGIAAGDRVAILSRNSHAFAAMRFALARMGAVLVPINFMLNAGEVAYILRSSGARTLLVGAGFEALAVDAMAAAERGTGDGQHAGVQIGLQIWLPSEDQADGAPEGMLRFDDLLMASAPAPDIAPVDPRALLQIIYTSGTESLPKGAMLSHEAVLWEYVTCIVEGNMQADDVVLHALPLYHCAQLDVFLGPAVYLGATNIITGQPRPDVILPLIARHRVNAFFAPPSIWIALLRSPLFDGADLASLAKGYYGASIMPVEVLKEMQRRMPGVRLWNFYGQTEIAPLATVLHPDDQLRKAGSAGKPALNVETRIVDDEMRDVAPGEVGEIVHRSPQLLDGYYNDPERTAEAFRGGWFHSGDLAVRDDEGYITIVDRKKDMIKSGGENVASREVEEMIFRIPEVSEVAVIGLPDAYWVEAVTAVIVLKEGRSLSEQQVIDFCKAGMAHFKVPKRVIFAEALPKNPSGKLLKRELRRRYEAPR